MSIVSEVNINRRIRTKYSYAYVTTIVMQKKEVFSDRVFFFCEKKCFKKNCFLSFFFLNMA